MEGLEASVLVFSNTDILACALWCVKAPLWRCMTQSFGAKLRYLRQQRGFTQTDVAHSVALTSHAHIAGVETGRDAISLKTAILVAQLFGVSMRYLLRDDIPAEQVEPLAVALASSDQIPQVFGARLRAAREAQQLTQAGLARKLQTVTRFTINNLEAGRKAPGLDLIVALADNLGVTEDFLLSMPN